MNLKSTIRIAFLALVRNKMRAALTMLGITIGVAAVIALVSVGQGASASVQKQIEGMGANLLFVSAGSQNVGGARSATGDSGTNTLTIDDLTAIRREIPSVAGVSPMVNARAQLVSGNLNVNTQIQDEFAAAIGGKGTLAEAFDRVQDTIVSYATDQGYTVV